MEPGKILAAARCAAGLSQEELAERAGTSRPTLSAYEHGHRSPTLRTAVRILAAAGFELIATQLITFQEVTIGRGRVVLVPSRLPRMEPARALARLTLPLHLNWSQPGRVFDLGDRRQRARVYEIVLREGTAEDLLAYVDGVLLVELWDELVLPREVRAAWEPVIEQAVVAAAQLLMVDAHSGGLTAFQVAVAELFFPLRQSEGFLLAGGAALGAQGLTDRLTQDLDHSRAIWTIHAPRRTAA